MESEQRVVIGTQVSRETLAAAGVIKHPAEGNAVKIRWLNTNTPQSDA